MNYSEEDKKAQEKFIDESAKAITATGNKTLMEAHEKIFGVGSSAKPKSILQTAQEIIYGDREKTYGHPSKNLELIAQYWSSHINSKYNQNIFLTSEDVCGMMILLKQARLANSPEHLDSLVDLAGYAALQERILSST